MATMHSKHLEGASHGSPAPVLALFRIELARIVAVLVKVRPASSAVAFDPTAIVALRIDCGFECVARNADVQGEFRQISI